MHLADHIRPLLRDHDCVIIPDFGGLVAEPVPAHLSAARQQLAPPAKQVAFNQSLTRNDGLLVDALSQYLRIPTAQAREVLRLAVEDMHLNLRQSQRTELPGIGVFRQAPGRGLSFDYTGTDNLLPAAFGLPSLSVRPVLATDARLAREKRPALLQPMPRLRPAAAKRRLSRVLTGVGVSLMVGLLISASYLLSLNPGLLLASWQDGRLPSSAGKTTLTAPASAASQAVSVAPQAPEPQQAALAHNGWNTTEAIPAEDRPLVEALSTSANAGSAATANPVLTDAPVAVSTAAGSPAKITNRKTALPVAARPIKSTHATAPGLVPKIKASRVLAAAVAPARKAAVRPASKVARLPLVPTPAFGAAAPASVPTAVLNRPLGRSYVIAGAFATQAGAQACRRNLLRGGFSQAKVLRPNRTTRRFRASAADYADVASARQAAAQLRFKLHTFFDVYSY